MVFDGTPDQALALLGAMASVARVGRDGALSDLDRAALGSAATPTGFPSGGLGEGLPRVGAGFGEEFGVSWGLLGRFWGSFFHACIWNGC